MRILDILGAEGAGGKRQECRKSDQAIKSTHSSDTLRRALVGDDRSKHCEHGAHASHLPLAVLPAIWMAFRASRDGPARSSVPDRAAATRGTVPPLPPASPVPRTGTPTICAQRRAAASRFG